MKGTPPHDSLHASNRPPPLLRCLLCSPAFPFVFSGEPDGCGRRSSHVSICTIGPGSLTASKAGLGHGHVRDGSLGDVAGHSACQRRHDSQKGVNITTARTSCTHRGPSDKHLLGRQKSLQADTCAQKRPTEPRLSCSLFLTKDSSRFSATHSVCRLNPATRACLARPIHCPTQQMVEY